MSDLLVLLREHGTALIDALSPETRHRRIAACPDWDLRELVAHTAGAQHWVRTVVEGGTEHQDRVLPEAPADLDELIAWSREALELVLATLSETPEEQPVWHVAGGAVGSWWWRRKAAVETALHRWDAAPVQLDPSLAAAGIDEHTQDFLPGLLRRPHPPRGTVQLVASDVERSWSIDLGGDGQLTVEATASDLLLWLWNRPVPHLGHPDLWKELSI